MTQKSNMLMGLCNLEIDKTRGHRQSPMDMKENYKMFKKLKEANHDIKHAVYTLSKI